MPINNEDFSGVFFVKDGNGNWVPFCKIADFSTAHAVIDVLSSTCIPNPPPADIMITGEITLSDESAAQWWDIAEGGIEIVER